MSRIIFKANPVVKKWAYPNLYGSGKLYQAIKDKSKLLYKPYRTPLVCLNPVLAFWLRTKYEKSPDFKETRILIPMSDGGTVGVDMMELPGRTVNPSLPNVIVFPGGNETFKSTKPKTLMRTYLEAGYPRVFIANCRGKGHTALTSPRFTYPFGEFNDIHGVVEVLEEKFKDERWLLSGSCYGGSCIVDYLASENSKHNSVVGGVVHSMQWNVNRTHERNMKEPVFSLFTKPWLLSNRDKLLNEKPGEEEVHKQIIELIGDEVAEELRNSKMETEEDAENLYNKGLMQLTGYAINNREEYVRLFSCDVKVPTITKPLMVINAVDDITFPMNQDDIANIVSNPNLCLWLFAAGGHCAFVKSLFPVTNWIDDVMVECSNIVCETEL